MQYYVSNSGKRPHIIYHTSLHFLKLQNISEMPRQKYMLNMGKEKSMGKNK